MPPGERAEAGEAQDQNPFADFHTEGFEVPEPEPEPGADDGAEDDDADDGDDAGAGDGSDDAGAEGAEGGDEDDDEDDDEGGDEDDDEGGARAKSSKKSARERINELTRARREAERRAEALERDLQEIRRRLDAAGDKAPEKTGQGAAEGDTDTDPNQPPDPEKFDYGELDPRYIRALAKYESEQSFRELLRTHEQQSRAEQMRQKKENLVTAGSKKHDDFYEKVIVGAETGRWALSQELGELLVESDVGADIAYHLASHPEVASQIYRLAPLEQARIFGKLEAQFSAPQSAAPEKTVTATPSKAPAPVAAARGSGGKRGVTADTDDFAAFERSVQGG